MHLGGLDMGLTNIRLGDYIERSTINNKDLKYGIDLIVGVNSQGVFTTPKGNTEGVELKPYKIVQDGAFVYNPTRLELGSIAYRTEGLCIVSHLYIVFYLTNEGKKIIDPMWLYIYFRRSEFCREVTFRNFGSQRPEFNFNDMSDIVIPLPDIGIQKKYVDIYNSLLENQKSYERGLDDLRIVCEGYLDNLRSTLPQKRIGDYIELSEDKNESDKYNLDDVRGISVDKRFIETKANMRDVNLRPYYIVKPEEFAYVADTSRRGEKIAIAFNDTEETYICSSSYAVFRCKDENKLLPRYLRLYFERSEFNRYARFHSWGSARETFDYTEMEEVSIPIPSISVQRAIANIFESYTNKRLINERLKSQIKDICPILIKGSIEEARKTEEA